MKKIGLLTLRAVIALILLQTLYFKFTGQPESIYIFDTVGMEPWGRIGSGVLELIASMLLFIPSTIGIGSILVFGTMSGAIFMHLTKLGIEVQGDNGLLFYMAVFCWIGSALLSWIYRKQIPLIKNFMS